MKKGIIMEIKQDILVMMTPEGEFLTGRKQPDQQYVIGEEVPFFPVPNKSVTPKPIFRWNWKVSTSIITAMIVIVALFSSVILQSNKAYAYVSVDINPSMELALNHEQQVISITPYNEDAKMLLKELNDWEHDDVSEVTEKIFLLSEQMGYLKDNQNVLITSSFIEGADHHRESDLIAELNEFVQGFRSEHNANIIMKETSPEIRDEASEKGMTAGSFIKESEDKKKADTLSEPLEHEDAVINEEKAKPKPKPEMDKRDDRSKVQEQKVDPPVEAKNSKADKPENHQTNDKIHPKENKQKEKPVPSQNRNSSNHNDEYKYKSNRGDNKSSHNESNNSHSRGDDNRHHDRENKKDEKKQDQHERKENKKD